MSSRGPLRNLFSPHGTRFHFPQIVALRARNVELEKLIEDREQAIDEAIEEHRRLGLIVEERDLQNTTVQNQLQVALDCVSNFQQQQQQLFDEFVLLRSKYDELKNSTVSLLWETLPSQKGLFPEKAIPNLDKSLKSEKIVGEYELLDHLGDGQFATVHACRRMESSAPEGTLAAKVISKEKVTNLTALTRVSNEILTLRRLDHFSNVVR